jgi:cyclic-di-GMP-binding protein
MEHPPLRVALPDSNLATLSLCSREPAAVAEWVAQLPMAHVPEAAAQLRKMASELARLIAAPEARFELLEIIRTPAHYVCTRLDRNAGGGSAIEGHTQSAQALQHQLALGYKALLRDLLACAELNAPQRDLCGHAIHRVMTDLSIALLRTYEYYAEPPANVWLELNQLYGLAETLVLTSSAHADEQARSAHQLTITDVYLRIAMLATAKPNQLRPKDLSATYHALELWAPHLAIGTPDDDSLFVVDLDVDAAPNYREFGSHTGARLRGIRTDVLVYELEAYLNEIASDVPVPDYVGEDLLRHLAHAWGAMKKRSFRRARSSGPMKICVGLRSLHYYISGGIDFAEQIGTTDALLRREINPFIADFHKPGPRHDKPKDVWDAAFDVRGHRIPENPNIEDPGRILLAARQAKRPGDTSFPCHDAEIVDTSPAGYCVRWTGAPPTNLQPGELLGVRERDDARWCVAATRWIRRNAHDTLMGVELLAPRAIPCAVRLLQRRSSPTEYHRGVLLPALEAIGQPAMLITPGLPFRESQKVQIRRHAIQATGQLMRRVHMTESFTQFTFRMLDGYLESTQIDLNMQSLWDMIGADPVPQPKYGPSTGPRSGKK